MERVECIVIGAGVVGLAAALAIAMRGLEVVVIESEDAIGKGTSSRNSEVIHAGIYYPKESAMARLCREGRRALYAYCESRNIPHRRCGKLIVATNDDESRSLVEIARRGTGNGAELIQLSEAEALALEPELTCRGALLSPSTGIVDSHAYMQALRGDAEAKGATFAFRTPFESARAGREFVIETGGAEPMSLACRAIVNAAGLHAPRVARRIAGLSEGLIPDAYYAKGSYFSLSVRAPFSRLIYPVPVRGGLGVHLTLDLAGRARFGPDIEWVDGIDYSVDPSKAESFAAAIRRYWPSLDGADLHPDYAGVRPKIVPPQIAVQDFMIQTSEEHGVPGLVNLFGIESPGLTASLAIAEEVADRIAHDLHG